MGNIHLYFKVFPFVPGPVHGILLVLLFGVFEDLSRWTFEKSGPKNLIRISSRIFTIIGGCDSTHL